MISTYKIFQIIFGLIASVFILTFLIQYATQYTGFEELSQSITILKNFNKVAGDVYLTSNPIDFHDFSNYGLDECYAFFNEPDSPVIKCGNTDYPTYIPMIFHSGEDVLIDGSYIDMGWWTTRYLLVYPKLRIIYNPTTQSNSVMTSRLLRNITSMFNCEMGVSGYACNDINRGTPFPTALELEPRTKFGFCDGNSLDSKLCEGGTEECERYDMFTGSSGDILYRDPSDMDPCTASLPLDSYRLVRIEDNCPTNLDRGVCIEVSENGVGEMRIAGSSRTYIYKDILDIMALVIGGDEKNPLGTPLAESIYEFKNEVISRRIALGAKIMADRASALRDKADDNCLDPSDPSCDCITSFNKLSQVLCSSSNSVCELAEKDYFVLAYMEDLKEKMDEAENTYQRLVKLGCENV